MLDIRFIREHPERVRTAMIQKGEEDTGLVDEVVALDAEWRAMVAETDRLRAESKQTAKQVGALMAQGRKDEAQDVIRRTGEAKERIREMEERLQAVAARRESLLLRIPNVPHESVPVGATPEQNVVHSEWGTPLAQEWRKPHWELAEEAGWLDFKRGVKVAGAGFPFYVGSMARLQRALVQFFLDSAGDAGYAEIQPPYFVNEDSARGTGQIPDKEDMMYVVPRDAFFAIPTAEVPVTNFHRDEILEASELPIRYCAYTPCWRREAGSYGKDVRGLNRLHQFDKVELVHFERPEASYDALETLRGHAESLLQSLGLAYRVLLMCTGDMGFTQSKKYDLEVWSPGQQRWLEVSSCSNFESFQSRRMQVRHRTAEGGIEPVHTLNGSGLALPRVVAALLETGQEPSGRVKVPEALQSYLRSDYL